MLRYEAQVLREAEAAGTLARGRSKTSEIVHVRTPGDSRRALCGKQLSRSESSSGRECRSCESKLATARWSR
jgi:hypothetical protein